MWKVRAHTHTHLSSGVVKDSNHADWDEFVNAAAESFPPQSKNERDLLLTGHRDHVIQSLIQTTYTHTHTAVKSVVQNVVKGHRQSAAP